MIRIVSTPDSIVALFSGVLVACAAPTPVRAYDSSASPAIASGAEASGKSSDDTSEEAFRLIVVADFNRDGIADLARATSPAGRCLRARPPDGVARQDRRDLTTDFLRASAGP
jgi:hypothetical protein